MTKTKTNKNNMMWVKKVAVVLGLLGLLGGGQGCSQNTGGYPVLPGNDRWADGSQCPPSHETRQTEFTFVGNPETTGNLCTSFRNPRVNFGLTGGSVRSVPVGSGPLALVTIPGDGSPSSEQHYSLSSCSEDDPGMFSWVSYQSYLWNNPNAFDSWDGTECLWQPSVTCGAVCQIPGECAFGQVIFRFTLEATPIGEASESSHHLAMGSMVFISTTPGELGECEQTGVVQFEW